MGKIFQISEHPFMENELVSEDLISNVGVVPGVTCIVSEVSGEAKNYAIWGFLYGIDNDACTFDQTEETSIVFNEGFREDYFKNKLTYLRHATIDMTVETFIDAPDKYLNYLECLVRDTYGDYVYIKDQGCVCFDDFVRGLVGEKKYYFGAAFHYEVKSLSEEGESECHQEF